MGKQVLTLSQTFASLKIPLFILPLSKEDDPKVKGNPL